MHGQTFSRVIEPEMRAAEAALLAGHWQEALDDAQTAEHKQGITVFDTKAINHVRGYAHLQLHDYSAALTDFERVLATGIATPEETATISKTVSALQARAEWDRDTLPQQETESQQQEVDAPHQEAETSCGGELDLRLGELYYGFAEALRAFARLKGVPNVSPRILRLWTLYADTLADGALTTGAVKETPPPSKPACVNLSPTSGTDTLYPSGKVSAGNGSNTV